MPLAGRYGTGLYMFLLTFANTVIDPEAVVKKDHTLYYTKRRTHISQYIIRNLVELGASKEVANHIPIVPVGLVKQPFIPSDGRTVDGEVRIS